MFHFAPPEVNGFGCDHLDAVLQQVVPGLDVLRVALARREHDDGVGDEAVVLVLVPVRGDLLGLDELVDVRRQRQRDDVGVQAGLDGAGLVAGGAVGLLEADVLAVGGLLEGGDDLLVRLLRRRVGDQAEAARAPRGVAAAAAGREAQDHQEHQRQSRDRNSLTDAHVVVIPLCLLA